MPRRLLPRLDGQTLAFALVLAIVALFVLTPILLDRVALYSDLSFLADQGALANIQHILFGVIIIVLLIKEPDGLSALLRRVAALFTRRPDVSKQ